MKKCTCLAILVIGYTTAAGQSYERDSKCGPDTLNVNYVNRKTGERVSYQAFECTQVSKLGIRTAAGFNTCAYNSQTRNWLGNHNGALFGFAIVYDRFNVGVKCKVATVSPKTELDFEGDILAKSTQVNPVKIEYDFSYSINFDHNFSAEPFVGVASNSFHVIHEERLNKKYEISKASGLTAGMTVNKYIPLKDFRFLAIFVKYGYGFINYKKVHNSLGKGYSDISVGIASKGYFKQRFLKKYSG